MMIGKRRESGLWFAKRSRLRIIIGSGRWLYVAVGRLRIRIA